jgi:hypothetical protein
MISYRCPLVSNAQRCAFALAPCGYPLVGGTREHHFAGISLKPQKLPDCPKGVPRLPPPGPDALCRGSGARCAASPRVLFPSGAMLGGVFVKNTKKRVEQLLLVRFTFCQFSFPVLNIAIIPDPERQITLVRNSEIFQSLSSLMKFASRTLCARK